MDRLKHVVSSIQNKLINSINSIKLSKLDLNSLPLTQPLLVRVQSGKRMETPNRVLDSDASEQ